MRSGISRIEVLPDIVLSVESHQTDLVGQEFTREQTLGVCIVVLSNDTGSLGNILRG
jgi:hypothetical protein